MKTFLSNALNNTWLVSLIAILLFNALILLFNYLSKKTGKYFVLLYFFFCVYYLGEYKRLFYDTQGEEKSLIVFLTMLYIFYLTYMFANRFLIKDLKLRSDRS